MNNSIINLINHTKDEDLFVLSPITNKFEDVYLKVRKKENRIYSDSELILLPFASNLNPHKNEWDLRAKSFLRFKEYLNVIKQELNILDLGCGNGWFCGQLSKIFNHNYYCVDVNLIELKQGSKVFKSDNIKFIYTDIFNAGIPQASFDIITVNAAVQYFPDLKRLIERLTMLITERGEIHILDSPFYSIEEVLKAKKRTMDYYSSIGFSEMAEYYHHHTRDELSTFKFEMLYHPNSLDNKIKSFVFKKDSPFPWIKITR